MAKRKLHENSLKNLENGRIGFNESVELARKAQRASVEKRKQNKIEKKIIEQIAYDRAKMCDKIYQLIEENDGINEVVKLALHKAIEEGNAKDLIKLLELIKLNDKQDINLTGDVGLTNTTINILPIQGKKDGNKS